VHYFEYTSDFYFPGEAHDFWEFLYVDKGEVDVTADTTTYILKKGDIIFHKPMEFHSLWANGVTAPNLVVVSFECNSPAMGFFEEKIFKVGDSERNLMARIINEAQDAYSSRLDDPGLYKLERRGEALFGSEQMIKISLERMLIQLIRKGNTTDRVDTKTSSSIKEKTSQDMFNKIVLYLEANVCGRITLEDVCRDNLIGRSYLQKLFREKNGGGVMEYFARLKIEAAKQSIRENALNFTEIAHNLGYTSIHYFSRHFKIVTGMTPSEYSSSVKIRSESSKERLDMLK
jgi:AraC-like DNA-binding protein